MKDKFFKLIIMALLMLAFSACIESSGYFLDDDFVEESYEVIVNDEESYEVIVNDEEELYEVIIIDEEEKDTDSPELINVGIPPYGIRLYFAYDGINWSSHLQYRIIDLSQVESYYEVFSRDSRSRYVFMTDIAVYDFRVLRISRNLYFTTENADKGERLYHVRDTLYHLHKFTPDMPFVISGVYMGCIFAESGFSFVDTHGITRYFLIHGDASTDRIIIAEF